MDGTPVCLPGTVRLFSAVGGSAVCPLRLGGFLCKRKPATGAGGPDLRVRYEAVRAKCASSKPRVNSINTINNHNYVHSINTINNHNYVPNLSAFQVDYSSEKFYLEPSAQRVVMGVFISLPLSLPSFLSLVEVSVSTSRRYSSHLQRERATAP